MHVKKVLDYFFLSKKMEQLLKTISSLSKQKRLVPAEQIICTTLLSFEDVFPKKITDDESSKIEKELLALYSINNGELSMQCSVRIAKCLLKVYSSQSSPKLWDLITFVTKKPSTANIYGVSHIIDAIGSTSKSMLPGLVKKLILVLHKFPIPCLMALTACVKVDKSGLKNLVESCYNVAMKNFDLTNNSVQLLVLQLLQACIGCDAVQKKALLASAEYIFRHSKDPFVIDECSFYVAQIAFIPFAAKVNQPAKQAAEWSIAKKGGGTGDEKYFEEAFSVISQFKGFFPKILQHFLDLLPPQMIHKNLPLLFNYVRKTMQSEVVQLMSLFGFDVRKELFTSVSKEQPPSAQQLLLLRALQCDYLSIREIAALAMQLTQKGNATTRRIAASYFANLANNYPDHARLYLETATLFLANPPEDNPNHIKDFKGMATIATYILGASPLRNQWSDELAANIGAFLNRALLIENIFDIQFWAAFSLMIVLPKCLVPHELVEVALENFIKFFDNEVTIGDLRFKKMKAIGLILALFLVQHPEYDQAPQILQLLMDQYSLQCQTSRLAVFLAGPKVIPKTPQLTNIVILLLDPILKAQPSPEYTLERIKCPMPTGEELLAPITFKEPKFEIIFDKISAQPFVYYTLENFSKLAAALEESAVNSVVNKLIFSSENKRMGHNLLLSIVKDPKTRDLLPTGLHATLIDQMSEQGDPLLQQVIAEVVGIWVKDDIDAIKNCIKILSGMRNRTKCLVYSAIFAHAVLDENLISMMMHELDDIAKNTNATPYALHALSVLYSCHSVMLGAMRITDIQCHAIIQFFDSSVTLDPFNLYYLSLCFQNLLPILSPEIAEERASIIPMIKLIIQSFRATKIPFSTQIMFRVLRGVFAFARALLDKEPLVYPTKKGASIPLQLAACGAFADKLKIPSPEDPDFFDLIPNIFVLLQRSNDKRASEFINAVANCFAEDAINHPDDEETRKRLKQWIKLIKTILSASALPNTGDATIEADILVKNCALALGKTLLPVLGKSKPLLTECLDDLMTSTTRSIETKKKELTALAFQLMHLMIIEFEEYKTEGGNRLLELYDSQFSIAVRFGFQSDLALSGSFLIKYLGFHYENLKQRPEEFQTVLNSYVHGLTTCKQRNFAFLSIASSMCSIARQNASVFKLIESFSEELVPMFSEVIRTSMKLWTTKPPKWAEIAQFRSNYETFYRELASSFVWLQSYFKMSIISANELVKFFNEEISHCTESWRIISAFEALAATFMYYADEITPQQVNDAISSVHHAHQLSPQLLSTALPSFLLSCSRLIKEGNDETWEQLVGFALKSTFSLESLAHLVQKGPATAINELADEIAANVVKELKNKGNAQLVDESRASAFFVILFNKNPACANRLINTLFNDTQLLKENVTFLMNASKRALLLSDDVEYEKPAALAWKYFIRGGMVFISDLLLKKPSVGAKVFTSDNLQTLQDLCINDANNVVVFLQFCRLGLEISVKQLENVHDICVAAGKIAIASMSQWGADVQRSREAISNSINILSIIKNADETSLREAFDASSQRQKQTSVQFAEKQIGKLQTRKKVRVLKTFSSNARKVQEDDEWQSL